MRIFIAALLPEEIRLRVAEYIKGLKPDIEGVKWEKHEKLHVTLKFLGEADESTAAEISSILKKLCLKYSPFNMNITRFGGFPSLENPRVLFVGLSHNNELSVLKGEVEWELEALGFNIDTRRFIPHITVGRVKRRFGINGPLAVPEKIAFDISEVGVVKSELNAKGSVYTPLEVFDLTD